MIRRGVLLLVPLLLLAGCSPVYVLKAGCGELKILWRRQPIERVLARDDLDPETREKLKLVLQVRPFAKEIGLRVGGSYRSFAEVDESQVVHLVVAAKKLSLELHTWWFPIVGRVPYKGFFSKEGARAEADELERQGYDTIILPSVAFSTLGWFDDPLLSTVLRYDRVGLVSVVLHELLHNTFYASSQAGFNESFADFAGDRAAIEFFARNDGEQAETTLEARRRWGDAKEFSAFLGDLVETLRRAYDAGITLDERDKLFEEGKRKFAALPLATGSYRGFAEAPWNNAFLLHRLTYYRDLDAFEAMYEIEDGDLRAAIARVIEIAGDAGDPFEALRAATGLKSGSVPAAAGHGG